MPEMEILYIASPSYSGSTLLSRLLHAHSDLICVGELRVLSKGVDRFMILQERQCTCGVLPIKDCPFWKSVDFILRDSHGLDLVSLDLNAADEKVFRTHNQAFLATIQQVSGKNIIIDSSKNLDRLQRLKNAGFKITPIQLERDILGVVNSAIKYGKNWFKTGYLYWYYYQNLMGIAGPKPVHIRYENLSDHPRKALTDLLNRLDLRFEEVQLQWANIPSHFIGGNPMRYQKSNIIQKDESWKKELKLWQFIFIRAWQMLFWLPNAWQAWLFKRLSNNK